MMHSVPHFFEWQRSRWTTAILMVRHRVGGRALRSMVQEMNQREKVMKP